MKFALHYSLSGTLTAALLGLIAGPSSALFAQPSDAEFERGAFELEEIVVTGSFIPTMVGETFASPVTVISREEIAETGVGVNLLEVMRKSIPQFSGSANLGNSNAHLTAGSTGGGAQLSLRNTDTLVLIDNRRAAFSPIAGTGGYQFVDLNLIPVSAVERVEVLKDGASAIYGSDATAGVVNIRLRDDFEGLEVNGRYGISSNRGHWSERRAGFAAGARDGALRVFAAGEWNKTDPLWLHERDFSDPVYATYQFPGVAILASTFDTYILDPERNAPPVGANLSAADAVSDGIYVGPFSYLDVFSGEGDAAPYAFNLAEHETLLLGTDRRSFLGDLEYELSPTLTAFGNLLYSRNDTTSQLNAQPMSGFAAADHPYNPFDESVYVYNRFVERPRLSRYDTTSWRAVGGLRGKITADLQFEVGALLNRVNQDYENPGVLDSDALARLTAPAAAADPASPSINLFARQQDPAALDAVTGVATSDFESELSSFDARLTGTFFTLPAGDVRFATGAEYRREALSGTADENSQPDEFGNLGWTGGTSLQPFSSSRDVSSIFAELQLPLVGEEQALRGVESLILELAMRHESYSDTNDSTVPKVSLIWQPLSEDLLFRATYSESFNAPTLYALSGPVDIGFTSAVALVPAGESEPVTWGQANIRGVSNPDLAPSTSESVTAGVVWSPSAVRGLTLEVDYFRIEESDIVGTVPARTILQDVESFGPASSFADQVRFGSFSGSTVNAPGDVFAANAANVYVTSGLLNLASQQLEGVDLGASYSRELGNRTFLSLESRAAWLNHYRVRILPQGPAEETAGRATTLNGTMPDWRVYNTASLRFDTLTFFVGHTYLPAMPYEGAPAGTRMGSYQTFDLAVAYAFADQIAEGLSVRVGVNNVANEMPPLAPELYSQANADIATYDPVGRLFFVEANYRF